MIPEVYPPGPDWLGRIQNILELLGRISAIEETLIR